ncbi:CLUMA_CG016452, isoform A [Clunio marinus]|uniref:CLUMA_CG016452, isoform A n=1 Tax=Clunio marinus TaxID=568069 RepID=A0A1J1IXA2_9DIPT|nr:CLUMA_CG016452, isoform A [Clunio marinus]
MTVESKFIASIVTLLFSTFLLGNGLILDCQYTNVTAVTHNHIAGRNNSDVLGLLVENSGLMFLPQNIDNFFPNLESLNFRSASIQSLKSSDLNVFPNLIQIDFFSNLITQLDFHIFEENLKLRAIRFQSNPLNHIGHGVFDHLNELTSIHTQGTCHPLTITNNRNQVVSGIFNFFRQCPPTLEMMEREILTGRNFGRIVDEQIADQMNPLTLQVFQLRQELIQLEHRIAVLERN